MKPSAPVSVSVVIPVYKAVLSDYEQIALTQCIKILGAYPIWLVAPHSLDISVYQNLSPTLQARRFDKRFFTGVQSYNRLMLSEEFYQAFSDVEYILIHQLDAFVFRDELADWCHRGFDYIGAPWLRDRDFANGIEESVFMTKRRLAILLDLKKEDGVTPREITSQNGVGNGGLSLRRIPAMLRCLTLFRHKIEAYERMEAHQYNEDIFWGVEVNRYRTHLRIPDYRTAMRFAVEFFPERAIERYNGGQLPFGCHAWHKHGTDYWRSVFARYGYQI